jgi:alkylhydroperoxidase family enzyme
VTGPGVGPKTGRMSRIPPADATAAQLRGVVDLILAERGALGELYPMLLHSPGIATGMISLGNGVRKEATLPAVLRELVICRVGLLNQAGYEVMRHRQIAESLGEDTGRLDALEDWAVGDVFDATERSALLLTDEMTRQVRVADATFDAVDRNLDERQVLELVVTIAYYNMISRILVALHVG